jgi:hypothetical protein
MHARRTQHRVAISNPASPATSHARIEWPNETTPEAFDFIGPWERVVTGSKRNPTNKVRWSIVPCPYGPEPRPYGPLPASKMWVPRLCLTELRFVARNSRAWASTSGRTFSTAAMSTISAICG